MDTPSQKNTNVKLAFKIVSCIIFISMIIAGTLHKGLHDHLKLLIGIALAGVSAITLNMWAAIITILYSLLQIGLLIPNYITLWKNRKNGK